MSFMIKIKFIIKEIFVLNRIHRHRYLYRIVRLIYGYSIYNEIKMQTFFIRVLLITYLINKNKDKRDSVIIRCCFFITN